MDHKEQIVIYLMSKIHQLKEKVEEDKLTKDELVTYIEMLEDLLRDYFNLSDWEFPTALTMDLLNPMDWYTGKIIPH